VSSVLRLCSGGGGYERVPDRDLALDLASIRRLLSDRGVPVVDARVLLIASIGTEVTISRRGRLLFKTSDPGVAERALERLFDLVPALRDAPSSVPRVPSR
jgi:hypothetical protein